MFHLLNGYDKNLFQILLHSKSSQHNDLKKWLHLSCSQVYDWGRFSGDSFLCSIQHQLRWLEAGITWRILTVTHICGSWCWWSSREPSWATCSLMGPGLPHHMIAECKGEHPKVRGWGEGVEEGKGEGRGGEDQACIAFKDLASGIHSASLLLHSVH